MKYLQTRRQSEEVSFIFLNNRHTMRDHSTTIEQLPKVMAGLSIEPGHKTLLTHQQYEGHVYVVLLTDMPGQTDKIWVLNSKDYYGIYSLHESRDRWVRNRIPPTYTEPPRASPQQASLF